MIRIAIIDNDLKTVEGLKVVIYNYFGTAEHAISVFSSAIEFISDTITPVPAAKTDDETVLLQKTESFYDIVIMEADFPHFDGLAAAKKLNETDDGHFLIIMSKTDKYALAAYSVEARDYLLKPVSSRRLETSLKRAEAFIESRKDKKKMLVTVDGILRRISLDKLKYIEVNGHFLKYHLIDETLVARGKLDDKEEELKGHGFYRIYKCYLVNMNYVDKVSLNSVFIGGEELLISRFRKKEFIAAFKDYIIN